MQLKVKFYSSCPVMVSLGAIELPHKLRYPSELYGPSGTFSLYGRVVRPEIAPSERDIVLMNKRSLYNLPIFEQKDDNGGNPKILVVDSVGNTYQGEKGRYFTAREIWEAKESISLVDGTIRRFRLPGYDLLQEIFSSDMQAKDVLPYLAVHLTQFEDAERIQARQVRRVPLTLREASRKIIAVDNGDGRGYVRVSAYRHGSRLDMIFHLDLNKGDTIAEIQRFLNLGNVNPQIYRYEDEEPVQRGFWPK